MRVEKRNNGYKDVDVLIADEGKVLVRKGYEEDILGYEIWLGYSHYIGGVKQDPPHLDVPDDFTEIDKPEDYPDPEPEDVEISDSQALKIITGE